MRKSKKTKQKETIEWCRRRRRQRSSLAEKEAEEKETQCRVGGGIKFFGCYLLTSLSPRHKGHSYIGFTVNPKRRIRQHNGEITCGASTTKKKRPWEMVLCIHGFHTNVAALQFEWAWQHPRESIAVREAAATFKNLGGLANKIKLALTMLTLPSWHCMDLTVSFFSTKYMKHAAGCPTLPRQMKLHFCSMDELPCYCHPDHPYGFADEDEIHSHGSDISTNFGEHRREYPTYGFLDVNPALLDSQSCTLEDASEHMMWDRIGFGGPSEEESPTMAVNGTQEEHSQSSHQLPSDVHVLRLNQWDHLDAFGTGIVPDNEFLILEEQRQPSHQLPADVHSSARIDLLDDLRLCKEIWTEDLRTSFPIIKKHIEPREQPEREQSSVVGCLSITENFTHKEDIACTLIDEIKEEQSQPTKVSPVRFADTVQSSSTEAIEVIDLLTPSPDCRIVAVTKQRRVSSDCPDIIDLTRSPLFLEL